jgi:hypothetical protein
MMADPLEPTEYEILKDDYGDLVKVERGKNIFSWYSIGKNTLVDGVAVIYG